MELLIDTWNVLHQTGILPPESAGIGLRGLGELLKNSRWAGVKITFVCDGTPSDIVANDPKFHTIFTGPKRRADDDLMDLVASSSSARSITVITSDREIIKSIKANGASHLSSAAFLEALVKDQRSPKNRPIRRPSGLSSEHAEEWKKEFGIHQSVVEELGKTTPTPIQENICKNQKPNIKEKAKQVSEKEVPLLPDELLNEARKLLGGN